MWPEFSPDSAYAQGYLAALDRSARQLPGNSAGLGADPEGSWLAGYDDAETDGEFERTLMLEGFLHW